MIIPGESPEELEQRCDEWEKDLGAVTAPERYEVFNAVHATWRHDRMRRAEAVALAALVDKTAEHFHDQKEQEARELIARLPETPGAAIQGLRNLTAGLTWMIEQVEILADQVTHCGGLSQSQRRHLIHLCGKRPVDLFIDLDVAYLNMLYLALITSEVPDPVEQAVLELGGDEPPGMERFEFEYRVKQLAARVVPADQAHAELTQRLAAMLAELTERRELIALREERDLARAIEQTKVDTGPEGARRQRVENSMDRLRRGSLKELRALQKSRPELDDPDGEGTPGAPGPGTDPDGSPAAPAPEKNHDGSVPAEPAVTTGETRSVVTTGSAPAVETPAEPVKTATVETTEEADTPQKCRSEPTCQNGRRAGCSQAEALALDGAVDLTRSADTREELTR
jgi:hypothetical protein